MLFVWFLCAILSIAEWAPAGPTVRTGRSSKIKLLKKQLEPTKCLPASGEMTGVRMNNKLFCPCNKTIGTNKHSQIYVKS